MEYKQISQNKFQKGKTFLLKMSIFLQVVVVVLVVFVVVVVVVVSIQ